MHISATRNPSLQLFFEASIMSKSPLASISIEDSFITDPGRRICRGIFEYFNCMTMTHMTRIQAHSSSFVVSVVDFTCPVHFFDCWLISLIHLLSQSCDLVSNTLQSSESDHHMFALRTPNHVARCSQIRAQHKECSELTFPFIKELYSNC